MKQLVDFFQNCSIQQLICGVVVAACVARFVYSILTDKE
jgi:hypothetical protein